MTKFITSSIGKKIIVALTGAGLVGFLIGHLAGNLKVFAGAGSLNSYALFLHDLGPGLWLMRIGLIVIFVFHIVFTILLVRENRSAVGKVNYSYKATVKATLASRTMIYSGLLVLIFVMFHLAHFTLNKGPGEQFSSKEYMEKVKVNGKKVERKDVYKMVVDGFQNKGVVIFYVVCLALLCMHLSHGVSSIFQTLGLRGKKSWIFLHRGGQVFSLIIFIGYASIPLAIMFKCIK